MENYAGFRPPGLLTMHQREYCPKCFRVRGSQEFMTYSIYVCGYCGETYRPEEIKMANLCSSCLPEYRLYPIPLYHLSKTRRQNEVLCDHCGNPLDISR